MVKIAVIIPVYNTAKQLRGCIDSLLNQSVASDIVIILVDDGSNDNSGEICDQYASEHDNIYVLHKQNGGAASARNTGIDFAFENCDFDYIAFVDSDDIVHPQMYEKLMDLMLRNDADVASCKYQFISEDDSVEFEKLDCVEENEIFFGRETLEKFTSICGSVSIISPCMRLCKKELFEDLRFLEGYIEEDSMLLPYLLEKINKWVRTDAVMYFWLEREKSVSRTLFNPKTFDYVMVSYVRATFFEKKCMPKMKKHFYKEFMNRTVEYYCNARYYGIEKEFAKYRKLYNKDWLKFYFRSGFCFNEYLIHLLFRLHIPYAEKLYKNLNPDWVRER